MLLLFLILVAAVGVFWLVVLLLPSQRRALDFAYDAGQSPAALNGKFPQDDMQAEWTGDPDHWPLVTVIVPGRNEGHLLDKTLGSLCAMDYPTFRVLFIDDQSTDNTAEVCRELQKKHPHLRVIHNETPPPPGWVGKVWAVHQAEPFMHAGDYLLFADSDLLFHRNCLKQMVRLALHRQTDLTSLLPSVICRTLGELLGLLPAMVLITLRFSLYRCNDPKRKEALAAGGFLLAKRTSYEQLGGHASVQGQVIEDIALAQRAKRMGLRVFTVGTHDLMTARMYEGWADTYRGLKKNAYAAANYNPLLAAASIFFLLLAGVLLPVYVVAGVLFWIADPSLITFALAASGIIGIAAFLSNARRAGSVLSLPPSTAWLMPAGFAFYLVVLLGSIIDYYRGGNTWAGRKMGAGLQTLADAAERRTMNVQR